MTHASGRGRRGDHDKRSAASEARGAAQGHVRQRPGTSFHDLLYGIIAGIALTQFIDFGFWQIDTREPSLLSAWVCLLVLYLWGIFKMTMFWLGGREDFIAQHERIGSIRAWEYVGGVFMAMLLGLLPLAAVKSAAPIVAGSLTEAGEWASRLPVFLGAYSLVSLASTLVLAVYVPLRLRGRLAPASPSVECGDVGVEPRLLRQGIEVWIPVLTLPPCWVAWVLAARAGRCEIGLLCVTLTILVGSAIEEPLSWQSRLRHRAQMAAADDPR